MSVLLVMHETPKSSFSEARAQFPKALLQPEDGIRFSLDGLLLAAFAHRFLSSKIRHVAELGSSGGALLSAFALLRDTVKGFGLEKEVVYSSYATANFERLGLSDRLSTIICDLSHPPTKAVFDACLTNPPYYETYEGRVSKTTLRNNAMRSENTLPTFFLAAKKILTYHGSLCVIYPAWKLQTLFCELTKTDFGVSTLLPLASFAHEKAKRILVHARLYAKANTHVYAPLIVHEKKGDHVAYSQEIMQFCPFLHALL